MDELKRIVDSFKLNEVSPHTDLDSRVKKFISLAVITVSGRNSLIYEEVKKGISDNISPEEMAESIIQCTPYAGFPAAMEALSYFNDALDKLGVKIDSSTMTNVNDKNRMEKGIEAQYSIFGMENIENNRKTAPEELKHIQDYLSAYCFGDFYTRKGIDIKTRELLTFCILSAMGGCEAQLKAHIAGNLNMGNSRKTLIAALTWCVPYIGFPRTLNAINCVNEIAKE